MGGVWLARHDLFTRLRFVDATLMRLNVLLLMAAAFLPFPTGLLAQAFDESRDAERAAVVAYGATAVLIEALLGIMRRYASTHAEIMDARRCPSLRACSASSRTPLSTAPRSSRGSSCSRA